MDQNESIETAVFGGGCFWCTEAVFQQLRGVLSVTSGYAGGVIANPSYDQVAMGRSGHAEVIRIEFDPKKISFRDLLEVFFATHDPATPNQQGADIGPQYRSIILYTTREQREEAEKIIEELNEENVYTAPVTTELAPLDKFYEAEEEHRNFYQNNPEKMYCQLVISPKLKKFKEKFARLAK